MNINHSNCWKNKNKVIVLKNFTTLNQSLKLIDICSYEAT
jgi:hypothetical protein